MNLFPVYPLYDIEPVHAEGCYVYDAAGTAYLDLYGGHAVISIGHGHPHHKHLMKEQIDKIIFYSNSVVNGVQERLAEKLRAMCGYQEYSVFFCNSGAEANDHALKLASFHTGRKRILAFDKAFHGRTGTTLAVTDNPKISAPINHRDHVYFLPFGNISGVEDYLQTKEFAAVIIEPIQGVAGLFMPSDEFLRELRMLCDLYGTMLILDEVQSGYGRSGKFFAHQHAGIKADIIPMAKGMGNGFPIGGLLISPAIQPWMGMLGTTFGGNHLACAAGQAVLDVIEKEHLIENAATMGAYAIEQFSTIPGVKNIRGRGLMLGIVFDYPIKDLRSHLLMKHHIFTGNASDPNVLRILPPLNIQKEHIDQFITAITLSIKELS